MTIINNQTKIALFFGGKISQHLVLIKKAAKKLGVRLDLVSYNRVCFDTENLEVKIRENLETGMEKKIKNEGWLGISDYDVLFFRTTGKHWEEVNLIVESLKSKSRKSEGRKPVVVDPLVLKGRPSDACKAYQMIELKKAGIPVPRTIYGSLWYLYEVMSRQTDSLSRQQIFCSCESAKQAQCHKKLLTPKDFCFPVILKGSGGDRGTRVFKAENLKELEELVRQLRKSETEEGKRYMLEEFIENNGDYRVLVLGKKVLGVMKRSRQKEGEFRNNFSLGGKVEVADLPEQVKEMAVKAAKVCGLMVAGVDVIYRNPRQNFFASVNLQSRFNDRKKTLTSGPKLPEYLVLEVNKGPQFKGFMEATGIDVPREIVHFLASLKVSAKG